MIAPLVVGGLGCEKESNAPASVNEAWLASVMPLHGLVRHKASMQAFFIVKVYSVDMLVWEAVENNKHWGLNPASCQLQRKLVIELEGWEEIVVETWSMMHCFAKVVFLWETAAFATTCVTQY